MWAIYQRDYEMKIAFYSPHMSERGTETAMYDFAHYNEEILQNDSIILYNDNNPANHPTVIEKFNKRFPGKVFALKGPDFNFAWQAEYTHPLIDEVLSEQECDILYMQKGGRNDGVYSHVCKNIILCCSNHHEPHGDAYLYVSKWLSDMLSNGATPYIPIIIDLPKGLGNMREDLSIPEDAVVMGRTGGLDTWDIPWANRSIEKALSLREDLYFVFQNTPRIFDHDRVKYIKTTADNNFKSKFIETCDAMIHCRLNGESFGQSCAEFSFMNKRVITYANSKERAHIEMLKEKGLYYKNENELLTILMGFTPDNKGDWNCYKQHSPEIVMKKFAEIIKSVMKE